MLARAAPEPALADDRVFAPAFAHLSDQELLAHFRARQRPLLFVVEEPEEITPEKIAGIMDGVFTFNGETHALGHDFDWRANPSADQEWHILLHKFYYAVGLARAFEVSRGEEYLHRWRALTASWIAQRIPADFIAADVTGRRLQNWVYAWSVFVRSPLLPADFHRELLISLQRQTETLLTNLHKARNHRTLELYAIFLVATAFPEFAEASRCRAFALAELEVNAAADFQADGAHCEQSTHYHCIVLRNFLNVVRLAKLNGISLSGAFEGILRRALVFGACMHRPDGEIPALSDADGGSYLALLSEGARLLDCEAALAKAHSERSAHFVESGHVVLRSPAHAPAEAPEDRRYLVFDAGHTGQGNHGHLDALSFEAYAYGAPIVVDPGRYTYAEDGEINWRAAFRGTAAHSTVQIDGRDQARYEPAGRKWKITGPRAQARVRAFTSTERADYVHGEVVSAEYEARHERRMFFVDGCYWLILDTLAAVQLHKYDLRFQLTPDVLGSVRLAGEGHRWKAATPHAHLTCVASHDIRAAIETGWVSRRYGRKSEAPRLLFSAEAANLVFVTLLAPLRTGPLALSNLERRDGALRATVLHADSGVVDALVVHEDAGAEVWRTGRDGGQLLLLRAGGCA